MTLDVVTGNQGFIGTHLTKRVLDEWGQTLCIDIKNKRDIHSDNLVFPNNLGNIYHLAAIASVADCEADPTNCDWVNHLGTAKFLKTIKQCTFKTFILASSAAVYGDSSKPCVETDELKPLGPYGLSKVNAEKAILSEPNTVALRLFNVYGLGSKGVINKFIDRAMLGLPLVINGDGNQTRDFVYIADVCDAFMLASGHKGIFNIGSGTEITMNELADLIIDECKSDSKVTYEPKCLGDIDRSCADLTKTQEELIWSAITSLRTGIRLMIDSKASSEWDTAL